MIEYFIFAGMTGAGIAVARYLAEERKFKKLYDAFNNAVEDNERLFNSFTEEDYQKIADSLKNNLTDEELVLFQSDIKKQIERNNNFLNKNKDLSSKGE